jgi:hypothetical protein
MWGVGSCGKYNHLYNWHSSKNLLTVIHHLRSADILSLYTGTLLTDEVMRFWIKLQDKLIHNYSLVGYLLSPNQTIMDHAYKNRSLIHHEAVVNLIEKLIVDPKLVGVEKSTNLAELINNFWDEYHLFVNKQRMFKFAHMWEPAARGDCVPAYRWHQRWSLHTTKVLGKLACLVQSKILGIGTAERYWKQVKLMKSGQ